MRLKRIKRKKAIKIDVKQLKGAEGEFKVSLHNKFEKLEDEPPTIENLNKVIMESAKEVTEKKTGTENDKSKEDKEIDQLERKRKELRKKENKTTRDKIEYNETNKTVKKLRRKRARRKRKEFVTNILEQKKGPKEIYKHDNKKKIYCMKNEDGKNTTDREEILQICKQFYEKLYDRTMATPQQIMKSSPDNEEVAPFTEDEVLKCLKEMSKNKAPGPDEITSDVFLLGGEATITYLTKVYNEILQTKEVPPSWNEAKIIILFKKGDPGDIKNYRPISLLAHSYKLFTRLLQKRMEIVLDENQPRDQAGFRKKFSTTDHIYTLNQVIEKTNEYNLPLCVGFIGYEKAFDSVKHFAIIEALRTININETYVQILENIYHHATARIHIDNLVSEEFKIKRGVRQADPISPKLFTAAIEEIFKKANLNHGIKIDGETLTNLRFADDVALMTEDTTQMEEQLNTLNSISKEVGLKMHKGKTKYMTNFETTNKVHIENEEIEKVQSYKYLGQTTFLKDTSKEEVARRIRAGWSCFGKHREIFRDDKMPISLKRQVFDQCVIPTMSY